MLGKFYGEGGFTWALVAFEGFFGSIYFFNDFSRYCQRISLTEMRLFKKKKSKSLRFWPFIVKLL